MCRRSSVSTIIMACAAIVITGSARGDEVASYLEQLELHELLIVHLEVQLEEVTDEEREAIILRLADLYADLLEEVEDPIRRSEIEERSRRLLEQTSGGATDSLRLALLRASYRRAETIAENHRLRLVDESEVARAKALLAEIIPALAELRLRLDEQANVVERRVARSAGEDADVLSDDVARARRLHAQCTFLAAWASYYESWLGDRTEVAKNAQRLFGELLEFGDDLPVPENVSVDLRADEAIARCILGMALCRSLTTSAAVAESWIDLLDHENTHEAVREQAPAWRLVVLLEHGEFLRAQSVLDRFADQHGDPPLHWLRLAAVSALDRQSQSQAAQELARKLMTQLASRGQLDQVFDLADRFGPDFLGASGFAFRYVEALQSYREAREAHGDDAPTADDSVAAKYERATEMLAQAAQQNDAHQFKDARDDCARLIAWCRYFQGRLLLARDEFLKAAEILPAERAAEALWMAVVSIDRLIDADPGNTTLHAELNSTIDRFLERFPSDAHAPQLLLRQSREDGGGSAKLVDRLLEVPENSEMYDAARERAAQILYRLFRDSRGAERYSQGNRFLAVALPQVTELERSLDPAHPETVEQFLVTARRILEIALNEEINRLVAAQSVLFILEAFGRESPSAMDAVATEIEYRRIQERLYSRDVEDAAQRADALWRRDPAEIWSRLAARAMFQHARRTWQDAAEMNEDDAHAVELVVRFGRRVLVEHESDARALDQASVLSLHAVVAEAMLLHWQRTRDRDLAEEAIELYRRLLARRPATASFLRSIGLLAEGLGRQEEALESWRSLVSGLTAGSEAWFEAKFHLIRILVEVDPVRARAVMNQHKMLHATYGPEPWGAKLKALDERLPPSVSDDEPGEERAGGGA